MVSYCALTDLTKLFWHSKNAMRQVTIARHPVIENQQTLAHWIRLVETSRMVSCTSSYER